MRQKICLFSDHATVFWDLEVFVPNLEVFENIFQLSRFNIIWEKSEVSWI